MNKKLSQKSLAFARLLANPHILRKLKSPSIYRIISANNVSWTILKSPWIYVGFTSGIILLFTLATGMRLIESTTMLTEIKEAREQVLSEIAYWEETTKKYTGYRDGYFTLAVLEYQIGNEEKARVYLDKTLELDPNFQKGRDFSKKIE